MDAKGIHFSIDDTLGCFRWLTKNKETVKTIFDSYVFSFAREIYETYGIETTFYCMYTDGVFTLADVPDCWKEEFVKNSTWMKFGFHAYDGNSCYKDTDECRIESDYDRTMQELTRITGGKSFDKYLRLHFFAGNESTVAYLTENGVRGFLCADDDRGSYDLSKNEEEIIRLEGWCFRERQNCEFLSTDVRIEYMEDISDGVKKVEMASGKKDKAVIFTHEIQLGNKEIRKKITGLFEMCRGI